MDISIDVYLEDTIFDGSQYDEGENKLYDDFIEWMNSKEADKFINNVTDYLSEWDSNVQVEGGTLLNPNGLIWFLNCKFSLSIDDLVAVKIKEDLNTFLKSIRNCPVPLEFRVYVE